VAEQVPSKHKATKTVAVQTPKPDIAESNVCDFRAVAAASNTEAPCTSTTSPCAVVEAGVQTESIATLPCKVISQAAAETASSTLVLTPEVGAAQSVKDTAHKQRRLAVAALSMAYARVANVCRSDQVAPSKLTLVGFSLFSNDFEAALLRSDTAQRLVTRGVEVQPPWAHGAKILVDGISQETLEQAGIQIDDLRPWHALVFEEDVPRVRSMIQNFAGRKPRVRSAQAVELGATLVAQDNSDDTEVKGDMADSSESEVKGGMADSSESQMYVCRTFVHVPEPKMISPRTCCTQSSPDPHERDCVDMDLRRLNPRVWGKAEK
jgi:hypothetical protein